MTRIRKFALAVTLVPIAIAATACGGESTDAIPSEVAVVKAGAYPESGAAADKDAGAITSKLAVATVPDLGSIITTGDGMTLYRFDKDTAKPPKSNCEGDCAAKWPPVLVPENGDVAVEGVDKALVSSLKQLSISGWPAYTYAQDTAPGEVKGQGVGGTWFGFTSAGKKAIAPEAGSLEVKVMSVAPLGQILTDAAGMTLYRFDKDTANPPKSNCVDDCAVKWPPVLVPEGASPKLDGADASVLGTVERGDGSRQLTAGGWPLYLFADDKVPCDIKGQGVGGTWFAAKSDGGKATG
jgi:predicted lipoprotein with Yx(FWY)xxD motif